MARKILCECGHLEFQDAVEEIDGKLYCNRCWKDRQCAAGKIETGCIAPEAAVCPDREPACVDMNCTPEERMKILSKASCYRGHSRCECKNIDMETLLKNIGHAKNGAPVQCPEEGCFHFLSVIKTELRVTTVCPRHGVVYQAILDPESPEDEVD